MRLKLIFNITVLIFVAVIFKYSLGGDSFLNMNLQLRMDMLTYEKCSNEGNGQLHFEGRQSRKNRTLVIENANWTFLVPLDNKVKLRISIDIWGNGGWRPNGFVLDMDNGCSDIMNILGDEVAKQLFGHVQPKLEPKCPIKPGHYAERDMDVAWYNKMKIPSALPGKWRLDAMFIRKSDNVLLGCYRREVRVGYVKQ